MMEKSETPFSKNFPFQSFSSSSPASSTSPTMSKSWFDLCFVLKISHFVDVMCQWDFLSFHDEILKLQWCLPSVFAECFKQSRMKVNKFMKPFTNAKQEGQNHGSGGCGDGGDDDDNDDEEANESKRRKSSTSSVFISAFDKFLESARSPLVQNQLFPLGKLCLSIPPESMCWSYFSNMSSFSQFINNNNNNDERKKNVDIELDFDRIVVQMKNVCAPDGTKASDLTLDSPFHQLRSGLCSLLLFRNNNDREIFDIMSIQYPEHMTSFKMHSALNEFLNIIKEASTSSNFETAGAGAAEQMFQDGEQQQDSINVPNGNDCDDGDGRLFQEMLNSTNPLLSAVQHVSTLLSQKQEQKQGAGNDNGDESSFSSFSSPQTNVFLELLKNQPLLSSVMQSMTSSSSSSSSLMHDEKNEDDNPLQKISSTIQQLLEGTSCNQNVSSISSSDRESAFQNVSQMLSRLKKSGIMSFYEKFFNMIRNSVTNKGGDGQALENDSFECDIVSDICKSLEKAIDLLLNSKNVDIGINRPELTRMKKIVNEIQNVQEILKQHYCVVSMNNNNNNRPNSTEDETTRKRILEKGFKILTMLMAFNPKTAKMLSDFGLMEQDDDVEEDDFNEDVCERKKKRRIVGSFGTDGNDDDDDAGHQQQQKMFNPLELLSMFTGKSSVQSDQTEMLSRIMQVVNQFSSSTCENDVDSLD